MIIIKKHTEGDSRVAKEVPTIEAFRQANVDHIDDVKGLGREFSRELENRMRNHDWTTIVEPFMSMFYHDMSSTIEGKMDFFDGDWSKLHYQELERHHLKRHCPDDVNMFDVIEMICDCVAAGMARSGEVYDLDIPPEVLTKAIDNTVKWLQSRVIVFK